MTILTFLRHATAQDRQLPIPDASRQLIGKGKHQAQRVAGFCSKHGLVPGYLLCSPLVRALETAQLLQHNLQGCPQPQTVGWLTGAEPESMVTELEKLAISGQDDIWLVGHEPDFSEVISLLLGSRKPIVKAKKASLIRLEVDFQEGKGQLLWSIPNTLMK
ncbi:SixA phosphatase family protein [Thiothrix nivea]|uniref:Putative phosphohistidine phosphatase, SixA n=1 Tax=Thiothrix nivea (strain ATCC 35100 / DSM 5205 / JP2) TaxID=870187 RepID=A0A656HCI9_THINJ|nr:histidine phosphatase family protein [Thiothrix nivea]EIJ33714.1 putative phosphohistidine phosphatase, SixA [Thiothrix nivea DSM 5205]